MASIYDALLDPEGNDQDRRKAMVAALRRQHDMGLLGQIMGLEPTMAAGASMQKSAQQSFGDALQQQQQARAAAAQLAQQQRAQENWQTSYDATERYRAAQLAAKGNQPNAPNPQTGFTPYQQAQLDAKKAEAERAATAAREGKVEKLSKALTATGAAELNQAVHDVNDELTKYQGKDIPGVGGLSNIPLVGKYAGGDEGKLVRSKIAAVRNTILKARSGGAVTPQEADRMYEELGLMLGATDEDLRNAWGAFLGRWNASLGNLMAPYKDVLPDYQRDNPHWRGEAKYGAPAATAAPGAPGAATASPVAPVSAEADFVVVNGKVVRNPKKAR